ncbi:hypothetical protein VPH35_039761 [Triticum aestivum]
MNCHHVFRRSSARTIYTRAFPSASPNSLAPLFLFLCLPLPTVKATTKRTTKLCSAQLCSKLASTHPQWGLQYLAPSSSTTSRSASPACRRWTRARSVPSRWRATATSSCTEGTRPSAARSAATSRCSSTLSAPGRPPGGSCGSRRDRRPGAGIKTPVRCPSRASRQSWQPSGVELGLNRRSLRFVSPEPEKL